MSRPKPNEKPDIQDATVEGKGERTFDLSLSALVSGRDALDREFEEKTSILSISAREVHVDLTSPIQPGSKLKLSLLVPQTLYLERRLQLALSGTVAKVRVESPLSAKRAVLIRLDRRFRIDLN
ncbi:MAG: hypothetical protein JW742_05060 [Candidatus Aminicenantes bacterium]|nr:hypothetical protein [Candidatus Aminicenantes bacterium]